MKKINPSILGSTLQLAIAKKYKLKLNKKTKNSLTSNFNKHLSRELQDTINEIFTKLKSVPEKFDTFEKIKNINKKYSTDGFVLKNGKTIMLRTNINKGEKTAPKVVGQAGYPKLNEHFGHLVSSEIKNQQDIKQLCIEHMSEMLPIFVDYFFATDYIVWIHPNKDTKYKVDIFAREDFIDLSLNYTTISFTKGLDDWNESTTLKLDGFSIAEIQTHSNRTFKFRFIISNLMEKLKVIKRNTETLGITAELKICKMFSLRYPENLEKRAEPMLLVSDALDVLMKDAFKYIPVPIEYTGNMKGIYGGQSKCPYDFILQQNSEKLSLKTNIGKKVCPPDVGQPSKKTFYMHFAKKLCISENVDQFNKESFKELVLNKVHLLIPIYIQHLFDSDYLLWIYQEDLFLKYKVISKKVIPKNICWKKESFSFSKNTLSEWKESNTLKYDNRTLGEFQVHTHRDCLKFRFNMDELLHILNI